ncbi:M16 family metallopeptidase [Desulfosarcina cetonica]|uniref:M16 family metallopeptidase n=1 Tax=Desulfosarcina cetonica TaxID=90730 RepID=UPI0006D16B99|nr:pitrilysin family protein [Desulfosarcina cetonica]
MIHRDATRSKERTAWLRLIVLPVFLLSLIGWPAPGAFTPHKKPSFLPTADAALQPVAAMPAPAGLNANSDLKADPSIQSGELANGFRFLLKQNQRPEQRVSVHLYIRAGSLNETDGQRGVAHFLEHMLFNGSTHFPPGELIRYFQSIGMQFGNDANAHTGFDETVYDIILPDGDAENLQKGLLVIHDYAMGALLKEEEIKKERRVILAEMRSRDSSAYRTLKATLAFEFPTFLVSRRLPIGIPQVVGQADRKLLKGFYDAWYRPENMVLVMVGDFDIALAQSLIKQQFDGFTPRAPAVAQPALGTIDHHGLNVFYHHEPEAGETTVRIETLHEEEPPADTAQRRGKELIAVLANRIVQNRLDALLKTPDRPFTSATVGSGLYMNRIRYSEISADGSAEEWARSLSAIEQELRRALLFGFSPAELERVKKDTRKQLENAVREAPTRNSTALAREMIRDIAESRVPLSPEQEQKLLAPLLEAVTIADVQKAFAERWKDEHRLVLVTGNVDLARKASRSPQEMIRNVFLTSAGSGVHRPTDETEPRFPYLPAPSDDGRIASREILGDLGITRIRFANGVRLNIKPTDYKTNEVLANLVFGEGRAAEPKSLPGLSLLTGPTLDESGLGGMDTNALERALAGKSTYVDFRIGETYFNFFAESVPGELELMFQLLYAHVTDPGLRDDAMTLVRERLRQEYQSGIRSIDGMLKIAGNRYLAGGDSRFGIPSLAAIDAIGLDDIRDWIMPQLRQAPLELSIVGDFDEAR